jgi:dynein heavy chain
VVEEYLEDYNSVSSAPMKLVMFLDAIEHVSRITRWGGGRGAGG